MRAHENRTGLPDFFWAQQIQNGENIPKRPQNIHNKSKIDQMAI
jgi:hypothetical protein